MVAYELDTAAIVKRLQHARMSLLNSHPFYAILLLYMKFSLDTSCQSAYTDGERIAFNPDFINELDDRELQFILMHEVLHAALGHPFRVQADYDLELYDKACDIIVNSNILYSFKMDRSRIHLRKTGTAIHLAPNGKEGYEYTLEEVYDMLAKEKGVTKKKKKKSSSSSKKSSSSASDKNKSKRKEKQDAEKEKANKDEDEAAENEDEATENQNEAAAQKSSDAKQSAAESADAPSDGNDDNASMGNLEESAAQPSSAAHSDTIATLISSGQIPTCDSEADLDEKLEALMRSIQKKMDETKIKIDVIGDETDGENHPSAQTVDDHTFWDGDDECHSLETNWNNRVMTATNLTLEKEHAHVGFGGPPLCAQRLVNELCKPKVDWRTLLNEFVQEEINDYSFSPPDRRMDDSPFFLPDFNEKDETLKNVWFLIDTSGSIGDKQITAAYSEIVSAIDMFDGKMEGLLSFTEVFVTEPIPFCSEEELLEIKPVGGGGNCFAEIFRYLRDNMMDDPPVSIVILTDGYDSYPQQEVAMGIPVLWLLNNPHAPDPPWGRVARFEVE